MHQARREQDFLRFGKNERIPVIVVVQAQRQRFLDHHHSKTHRSIVKVRASPRVLDCPLLRQTCPFFPSWFWLAQSFLHIVFCCISVIMTYVLARTRLVQKINPCPCCSAWKWKWARANPTADTLPTCATGIAWYSIPRRPWPAIAIGPPDTTSLVPVPRQPSDQKCIARRWSFAGPSTWHRGQRIRGD